MPDTWRDSCDWYLSTIFQQFLTGFFPASPAKSCYNQYSELNIFIKFLFGSPGTELSEQCAQNVCKKCGRAGSTCYPDRSAVQIMGWDGSGFSVWLSGPCYWDLILCQCEKLSRKCQMWDKLEVLGDNVIVVGLLMNNRHNNVFVFNSSQENLSMLKLSFILLLLVNISMFVIIGEEPIGSSWNLIV